MPVTVHLVFSPALHNHDQSVPGYLLFQTDSETQHLSSVAFVFAFEKFNLASAL